MTAPTDIDALLERLEEMERKSDSSGADDGVEGKMWCMTLEEMDWCNALRDAFPRLAAEIRRLRGAERDAEMLRGIAFGLCDAGWEFLKQYEASEFHISDSDMSMRAKRIRTFLVWANELDDLARSSTGEVKPCT